VLLLSARNSSSSSSTRFFQLTNLSSASHIQERESLRTRSGS
jgi:hypothetical protein